MTHDLLARAADVTLKEGRPLVLCPRETPLSAIHLENMLKLSRLGSTDRAAHASFYHRPRQIEDLIRYQVVRVLDQFGSAPERTAVGAQHPLSRKEKRNIMGKRGLKNVAYDYLLDAIMSL